jgi:succinoglycan biosynthesis protein ExoO
MDNHVTPRVSIIVPAYNAAGFLERALHSALAQTMPNLEVIVVDDASSDGTLALAREVAARDSRVRVLHNEHNRGMYPTYNRAIDAARGEWIAALDADDIWLPERLEQMLGVSAGEDAVSDDELILRTSPCYRGRVKAISLLTSHGVSMTTPRRISALEFVRHDLGLLKPLMRRSFLQQHELKYDADLKIGADFHLYFELLLAGARWLQLPNAYYLYSWHGENTSRDTPAIAEDLAKSNERLLLRHPVIAADPALVRALEQRGKEWESNRAFAVLSNLLRQRRGAELGRLLVDEPSHLSRAMGKVVRSLRRRALWRISGASGQLAPARYSARSTADKLDAPLSPLARRNGAPEADQRSNHCRDAAI